MRKSKTLARLRNNETVRMCCLGHFIPSYVRHAAHFGFDCIWLDLEHRYMDYANVMTLLAEHAPLPHARLAAIDSFIATGPAHAATMPSTDAIVAAARALVEGKA